MQLGLAAWHRYMLDSDPALLEELIAPDAVFHSPVVHTPQEGREKVLMYLTAAAGGLRQRDVRLCPRTGGRAGSLP